jgi:hypothetical protein
MKGESMMLFGRKKLLVIVAALIYSKTDSGDRSTMEACVEEADTLLDIVDKYKKPVLDKKAEKEFDKILAPKKKPTSAFQPPDDDLEDRQV